MEKSRDGRETGNVSIVSADEYICARGRTLVASWGFRPVVLSPGSLRSEWLVAGDADVYLLDYALIFSDVLGRIQKLIRHHPDSRVIVIGSADGESTVTALRSGAFACLEEPLDPDILRHAIHRAVESVRKDGELRHLAAELQQKQADAESLQQEMEYIRKRLMESREAFTALIRSMDSEREQLKQRIAKKINSTVLPVVSRLMKEHDLARYSLELDILVGHIRNLVNDSSSKANLATKLSPTELTVASLIRNGMRTNDIATQLFGAPCTIRKHRKNIRRKLRLSSSSHSLRHYLVGMPTAASRPGKNEAGAAAVSVDGPFVSLDSPQDRLEAWTGIGAMGRALGWSSHR